MPHTIFTAQLPHSAGPIMFQEAIIAGDGNCGFTLLGISRDEFADTLIPLAQDVAVRAAIWEEIREAIDTDSWTGPITTEGKRYASTIHRLDDALQTRFVAIARSHDLDYQQPLDDIILALERLGHSDDAELLRQANSEIEQHRAAYQDYCQRTDVFLAYLEKLRINDPLERLWLGNQSCALYAKVKNISLYIWREVDADSNQLIIETAHISDAPNAPVIHGFHTGNGTHYNLLIEDEWKPGLYHSQWPKAVVMFPDEIDLLSKAGVAAPPYLDTLADLALRPDQTFYLRAVDRDDDLSLELNLATQTINLKKPSQRIYLTTAQLAELELPSDLMVNQIRADDEAHEVDATPVARTTIAHRADARDVVGAFSSTEIPVIPPVDLRVPGGNTTSNILKSGTPTVIGAHSGTAAEQSSMLDRADGVVTDRFMAPPAASSPTTLYSERLPHAPSVTIYASGADAAEDTWDATELVRYLLRQESKKYSVLLAEKFAIVLDEEEDDDKIPMIPNLDPAPDSSDDMSPPKLSASDLAPPPPPPSPPPSEPGVSGSAIQPPNLKVALIGVPLLLQRLLQIIDEFASKPKMHEKVVIDFLRAIKEKSISLVSRETGVQHTFTLDKGNLQYSQKTVTETVLSALAEKFDANIAPGVANTNKFRVDPTLWSEELMQGFGEFYLQEFSLRARDPRLGAMDDGAFEKHCLKKYASEMKAQALREKFLLKGDDALDPSAQKLRIQRLIKDASKVAKGLPEHPLPELMEHIASELGHQTGDPKRASMWEFYSNIRQSKLGLFLANEYEALLHRGINPSSLSDQQLIKDYLRFCIESDHHVESLIDGTMRTELRFSINKDNKLTITEESIPLADEIESRLMRFGPDGSEDFLRNFDPRSVEHRRFARATIMAKGLNELIVESNGSKLWTLKVDSFGEFSCVAEPCPLPQVTTSKTKPHLFRFDEMQAYYKHVLEEFKLKPAAMDQLSFEKETLSLFERNYLAPRYPEIFPGDSKYDPSDVWDEAKRRRYFASHEEQIARLKAGDPRLVEMDAEAFNQHCLKEFERLEKVADNRSKIRMMSSDHPDYTRSILEAKSPEIARLGEFQQKRGLAYNRFAETLFGAKHSVQIFEPKQLLQLEKAVNEYLIAEGYADMLAPKFQEVQASSRLDLMKKMGAEDGVDFESLNDAERAKVNKKLAKLMREKGYGYFVDAPPSKGPKPPSNMACADGFEDLVIRGKGSMPAEMPDFEGDVSDMGRQARFHAERRIALAQSMEALQLKGPIQQLNPRDFSRLDKRVKAILREKGYGHLLKKEAESIHFLRQHERTIPELMREFGVKSNSRQLTASELEMFKAVIDLRLREIGYEDLVDSKSSKGSKKPTTMACADGLEEPVIRVKAQKPSDRRIQFGSIENSEAKPIEPQGAGAPPPTEPTPNKKRGSKKAPTRMACAMPSDTTLAVRGTRDFRQPIVPDTLPSIPKGSQSQRLATLPSRNIFAHFGATAGAIVAGSVSADLLESALKKSGMNPMASAYIGALLGTGVASGISTKLHLGPFAGYAVLAHTVSAAHQAFPHLGKPGSTVDTVYQIVTYSADAVNSTFSVAGEATFGPLKMAFSSGTPEEQVALAKETATALIGHVSDAVAQTKQVLRHIGVLATRYNPSKGMSGFGQDYRFGGRAPIPLIANTPAIPAMAPLEARAALAQLSAAVERSGAAASAQSLLDSLRDVPPISPVVDVASALLKTFLANSRPTSAGVKGNSVLAASAPKAKTHPEPDERSRLEAEWEQLMTELEARSRVENPGLQEKVDALMGLQKCHVQETPKLPVAKKTPVPEVPPSKPKRMVPPKPTAASALVEVVPQPSVSTFNAFEALRSVSQLQGSLFDTGPSYVSNLFGRSRTSGGLLSSYIPDIAKSDPFANNLWNLWSPASASYSLPTGLGGIGSVSGARTGLSWDSLCSAAAAEGPSLLGVLPSYLTFARGPDQIFRQTVEQELRYSGMELMSATELHKKVKDHLYSMGFGLGEMGSYSDFCSKLRSSGLVDTYLMFNPSSKLRRMHRSWGEIGGVAATVGLIQDLPDSAAHDADRYMICFPTDDGQIPFTEGQLKQIARENARAFYEHQTVPFFSLGFSEKHHLIPEIHPAFKNTLTGKVISLLDYLLKGLLNGGTYDQAFIESWFKTMNVKDEYLREHLIDLKAYCKTHAPGVAYASLREMMKRAGIDEESMQVKWSTGYKQPFMTSFRIISHIEKIERHGNAFVVHPGFDVKHSVDLWPEYQAYINNYHKEHGHYPEEYEKTLRCYRSFEIQLKEYLTNLPICRELMKMLGVINFYSYFYNTLQKMGKMPDLPPEPEVEQYTTPAAFPPLPVRHYHLYPLEMTMGDVIQKLHQMDASATHTIDALIKPIFGADESEGLSTHAVDRIKSAVTEIAISRLVGALPGINAHTLNSDTVDELTERFNTYLLRLIQDHKRVADKQLRPLLERVNRILGTEFQLYDLTQSHETRASIQSLMKQRWAEKTACLEPDLGILLDDVNISANGELFDKHRLVSGCNAQILEYFGYEKLMAALPERIAADKKIQIDCADFSRIKPEYHEQVRAALAAISERLPKWEALLAAYNKAKERLEFKASFGDDAIADALIAAKDANDETAFEATIELAARAKAAQLFYSTLGRHEDALSFVNQFTHFSERYGAFLARLLDDKKQYCHSTITFDPTNCKDGVRIEFRGGCGVRIPNITSKPMINPHTFVANFSRAGRAAPESWTQVEHAGNSYVATNMRVKDHVSVVPADYLGELGGITRAGMATSAQRDRMNALIMQFALNMKDKVTLDSDDLQYTVDPSGSLPIHHAAVILAEEPFKAFVALAPSQLLAKDAFGNLPIHSAATVGNVGVVNAILSLQALQLEAQTLNGDTPLIAAVRNGRQAVVSLLINKGANANHQPPNELFALYLAIQSNFPEIAMLLIERVPTLNLNLALMSQMTVLHLAIDLDMKDIAIQLVARGASLTGRRKTDGMSPYHLAAAVGDQELVRMMLAQGVPVNDALDSKKTALHIAAEKGHLSLVQQLLVAGADLGSVTLEGDSPLMLAIKQGHLPVAIALAATTPVNMVNTAKQTASLLAIENNMTRVADMLWQRGDNPELKDHRDLNGIYYLIRQGETSRFDWLLSRGAININQTIAGESLLALAIKHGQFAIKASLDKKGALFSSALTGNKEDYILNMALQHDEIGVLREWLRLNKKPESYHLKDGEYNGKSITYIAADRASLKCLAVLRPHLTDTHIIQQEVLIAAIRSRSLEAVVSCAIRDFEKALDPEGNNALHLAVRFGSREIMEYLLHCGFKTTVVNKKGQTAFHIALLNNDRYLLKRLMKETPKEIWPRDLYKAMNPQTATSITQLLIDKGYPGVAEHKVMPEDKEHQLDLKRQIAVGIIPNYARLKVQIDRLLKVQNFFAISAIIERYPAMVDAYRSNEGITLLSKLLNISFKPFKKEAAAGAADAVSSSEQDADSEEESNGHMSTKTLFQRFKKGGLDLRLYLGQNNPLRYLLPAHLSDDEACYRYSLLADIFPEAIPRLITDGIDGLSMLSLTLYAHKVKLFEMMNQSSALALTDDVDIIPLHETISNNRYDLALSLLNDRTVNKTNKQHQTPLMLAARAGNLRLMQALLNRGANPDALDIDGRNALHYAILSKESAAALFLLPLLKHKNQSDRLGISTLALAASNGLVNVIKSITQEGHYSEAVDTRGQNALHVAAIGGEVDAIQYLVTEAGFDVNQIEKPLRPSKMKTCLQRSPLQLAALSGQFYAVFKLMDLGADLAHEDTQGRTFFDYVLMGKNKELWTLVRGLIKEKYPKHISQLVLAAAQANQSSALLDLLVDDVDVNATNRFGQTALHFAAMYDSLAVAKLLLNKMTIVDHRNALGETALHSAARAGGVTMIHLLVAAHASIDLLNNDHVTPLYLACKEGRIGAVMALVKHGADFKRRDSLGLSPAQIAFSHGHFSIAADLAKRGDQSLSDEEIAKLPEFIQGKLCAYPLELAQCQGLYIASQRSLARRVAGTPGTLFNSRAGDSARADSAAVRTLGVTA